MFVDKRIGGITRYHLTRPKDFAVFVPEDFIRSVVPVSGKPENDTEIATGFIICVPVSDTDSTCYLVTSRHVVDKQRNGTLGVRVRLDSGKVANMELPSDVEWWYHPTEPEADVAVLPLDTDRMDVVAVSSKTFYTGSNVRGIGVGNDVSIIGLFTKLNNHDEHIPIVRRGTIAAMPKFPVSGVTMGDATVTAEMYLVEARSMSGLSGSPVFVHEETYLPDSVQYIDTKEWVGTLATTTTVWLLGVMHGHWNIRPEQHNSYALDAAKDDGRSIALGLSLVVPAKKIMEVLMRPELVAKREELWADHLASLGGTSTD